MTILNEELTQSIIGAAIEVHSVLGPGLLESAYEDCLCHELEMRGLRHQRQVLLPVNYKGLTIPAAYRIDVIVEDLVVLELKCVEKVLPIHQAQLLTYVRLSGKRVGLLMNFNVQKLTDGLHRRVI